MTHFANSLLLISMMLFALSGRGQDTDNHGIHAVPAPGEVVIDGRLDEWDLSGAVLICADVLKAQYRYSGNLAIMYDATNIYVAVRWRDLMPMLNRHDPRKEPTKGWAGDCLRLHMVTDTISHITAWYYKKNEDPFISIDYGEGMDKPFGGGTTNLYRIRDWRLDRGAEMAFLENQDRIGYVQELKLPWALITDKKVPVAGDQIACGVELLWGEQDWPEHRYADNLAVGTESRKLFWTRPEIWGPVFLEPTGNLEVPEPAWKASTTKNSMDR